MTKGRVIPFARPEADVERRIRGAATQSANVLLTLHARKRMRERHVTLPQVLECLRGGVIDEALHRDADGYWIGRFRKTVSGDDVRVVAKLIDDDGDCVLVVTIIR